MKNQTKFQKEDSKQVAWEAWFILSLVFFFGIFFMCTLENSIEIKELPYFLGISMINLIICLYYGNKPRN